MDTLGAGTGSFPVNLFYPRAEGNPESVTLALYDVRAANDIKIKFDFERNGWVVLSDLWNPESVTMQDAGQMHEVAFIDAWPDGKPVCDCISCDYHADN